METAFFAAGCFWGVQHYMNIAPGVISTEVGYMGGHSENPTYKEVKKGNTGHLETIKVVFDPLVTTYTDLCRLFFEIHDPTQKDGQGIDIGSQYLSAIFYISESQLSDAEAVIDILKDKGFDIATTLRPALSTSSDIDQTFFSAEDYHQHYFEKNDGTPDCHFRVKRF